MSASDTGPVRVDEVFEQRKTARSVGVSALIMPAVPEKWIGVIVQLRFAPSGPWAPPAGDSAVSNGSPVGKASSAHGTDAPWKGRRITAEPASAPRPLSFGTAPQQVVQTRAGAGRRMDRPNAASTCPSVASRTGTATATKPRTSSSLSMPMAAHGEPVEFPLRAD